MLELILIYLLVRGAAEAWKETKAAWGRSRRAYTASAGRRYPGISPGRRAATAARHDLGYGLSQLLHGFPQARHGFAQGWHEGRQAHVEARIAREKARTEHAETRAGALAEWQELRQRRAQALEEIRRQRQEEVPEGTPEPCGHAPERCLFPASCPCSCAGCLAAHESWVGKEPGEDPATYCGYCGTRDDEECPPRCASWTLSGKPYPGRENDPTYSYGPESAGAGWPSATVEHAHEAAQRGSTGGKPWVVTEYPPGGGPGRTVATYQNGKPVHVEPVTGPEQEVPGEGSPSTEGTTSMSDVTYDGVIKNAAQAVAAAEERAAEVERAIAMAEAQAAEAGAAQRQADVAADQMQALNVDSGTLGAMADHQDALAAAGKAHQAVLEALGEAKKAQAQVTETAQNVSATLQRGHQGLAEAHQNAPVEAADRPFYQN